MTDRENNVITCDFSPEYKASNPERVRAVYAETAARRVARSIEAQHDTATAFVRVPRGTPITIIERDDYGPWWSAIAGAIGFNALVWILALIIAR